MNLKKSIVGVLSFAMLVSPMGVALNQNVGILDDNTIFATQNNYNVYVDMNSAEEAYLYGDTATVVVSFYECQNLVGGKFTFSYDSELSYQDCKFLQGTGNVTVNKDNTITVSVSNAKGFNNNDDVMELYFKTPEESEDTSESDDTADYYFDAGTDYNVYIDSASFTGLNNCTGTSEFTSDTGIYVSSYKTVEEDNGVEYYIYKDHAIISDMYNCTDNDIEIPATIQGVPVTDVGGYVCISSAVQSINVSKDNKYLVSKDGVLYNKDCTELLLYPLSKSDKEYSVLETCQTIRSNAFYLANMEEYADAVANLEVINIPSSVTNIEEEAIYIYNKVITINGYSNSEAEKYAKDNYINFYNLDTNTLQDITGSGTIGDNLTWNLDSDGVITISGTGDMEELLEDDNTLYDLKNLITELVVEDGVTSISSGAFYWCPNLKKVTLADSVTSIGDLAFYACKNLSEITLSQKLESIGMYCFYGCSLNSIEFPNSLTDIGDNAFSNNSFIDENFGINTFDSIYIPENVQSISTSAFSGCTNLANITVDENNQYFEIYKDVLYNKQDGSIIFIPKSVHTLDIPNYVTTLTCNLENATNSNIVTINVPSSVQDIQEELLSNWNSLKDINVTEDNQYLSSENGVLYNKDKTTMICYPNAKKECVLVLPETVTSVDNNAFDYACTVTDIYYLGNEEDLSISESYKERFNIHYNSSPTYSNGDVDGNGSVSSVDLLLLKKYIMNAVSFSSEQKTSADLNEDSKVNIIDLIMLKKAILNA